MTLLDQLKQRAAEQFPDGLTANALADTGACMAAVRWFRNSYGDGAVSLDDFLATHPGHGLSLSWIYWFMATFKIYSKEIASLPCTCSGCCPTVEQEQEARDSYWNSVKLALAKEVEKPCATA